MTITVTNPTPGWVQRGRLLDAATPLPPADDGTDSLSTRFLQGVQLRYDGFEQMTVTVDATLGNYCAPDEPEMTLGDGCLAETPTFAPFRLYSALSGSVLNFHQGELSALIDAGWDVASSAAFARQLLTLMGAEALPLTMRAFGTAAVTVESAIALLEDQLAGSLVGRRGTIHMSRGAYFCCADDLTIEGDRLFTPNGTGVVVDAGYSPMIEPTDGAATTPTGLETYLYASGEVFFALTEGAFIDGGDLDFERNTLTRMKRAYGLVAYATPIWAVLATLDGNKAQP